MDKAVLILLSLIVLAAIGYVIWYNIPDPATPTPNKTAAKAATTTALLNTNPLANLTANNLTDAQVAAIANSVLGNTVSNSTTTVATDPGTPITGVSAGTVSN